MVRRRRRTNDPGGGERTWGTTGWHRCRQMRATPGSWFAITVHFNAARLDYLAEVLRSLAEFPVAAMHVALVTNTVEEAELAVLQRCAMKSWWAKPPRYTVSSIWRIVLPDLAAPRVHRQRVRARRRAQIHPFRLPGRRHPAQFRQLQLFRRIREVLRDAGLLPSFLRVEYNKILNGFVNSDNKTPVDLNQQPGSTTATSSWRTCRSRTTLLHPRYRPRGGIPADAIVRARAQPGDDRWEVRERAAMGLCYENVPESFQCRYVIRSPRPAGWR